MITLTAVALLTGILLACSKNAATSPTPSAGAASQGRTLETLRLMIVISSDRTKLTGYSKSSGTWSQIDGKGFTLDRVVAGSDVALYRTDDRAYGYSPITSGWSSVNLAAPADSSSLIGPLVEDQIAAISVPGFVHAFSAITGEWDSLKTSEAKSITPECNANVITVNAGGKIYFFGGKTGKSSSGF